MKPLTIEPLMDFEVQNLSGGELQRVALALCLGQPADIYLIDEPSAYLDSEQRIMASKVRTSLAATHPRPNNAEGLASCLQVLTHCWTLLTRYLLVHLLVSCMLVVKGDACCGIHGVVACCVILLFLFLSGHQALHHAQQEDCVHC
jgi:Fe-S cluster assembly ATPase SufC